MSEDWLGKQPYPRAHSVEVWTCGDPKCRHPHLILCDESGGRIAEAVMPDSAINKLADFGLLASPAFGLGPREIK